MIPARASCPLRAAALASPGAPAIVGTGGAISFAQLDARVSAVEERLGALGFGEGDRVALYLPKDVDYVVLLVAVIRAGLVACPVSTRLPAGGVAPLLENAGCVALVSRELAREREPARSGDSGPRDPGPVVLRPDDLIPGLENPSALAAAPSAPPPAPREIPLDRPATVVFTSGSTGAPKAALHTFGNHLYSALGSNTNIALAPGDRWLHSLPLYHVGGLSIIFRCLLARATMVLPEPDAGAGESVSRFGATHVSLVATQLRRLLREEAGFSNLKAILMGGGPIPPSLVDGALSRGLPVHTSYGLTETASQVTTTPPGASSEELRTAGRALAHREVRVSGEGEVLVRGRTLFAGYVEGGEVRRPLDDEGWFHTRDLGSLDGEGYLRITGRLDNRFVSGGENVQPEEIEAALGRVAGVEEAVVVPVPDPEFGERPVAFVRRGGGGVEDPAHALEPVLPRFKIPAAFHDWAGSGGMKPDRAALKERARRLAAENRGP